MRRHWRTHRPEDIASSDYSLRSSSPIESPLSRRFSPKVISPSQLSISRFSSRTSNMDLPVSYSPVLEHYSPASHVHTGPTYASPVPRVANSDSYTYVPTRAWTPAPSLGPAVWDAYIARRESYVRDGL
ncbi:hypothetical protein MSAN_02264500 [Mycena sanguinolenta]|uniref:Uncharacterized protein n=1 Tax=Mycena sanguinolenta TaxID=230812 RepID=A0A8H6XBD4_9AGAR|nr:hypothetical protein MSAN_02264500 [Mycena sanguinolenta]